MKKLIIIGIIIICMHIPQVNGQSSVGAKADVSLSDFWINESTLFKCTMKAGGSVGYFYKYELHENAAIQADLMFRYRASEIKSQTTGEAGDYRYLGMELPVYAMMQVNFDQRILYAGIGPFASFGLISRYEHGDRNVDPFKKIKDGKAMMHRWDFGVGLIIGYELKFGLQFNLNYHLGLRNILDASYDGATMISQLMALGLGYRF